MPSERARIATCDVRVPASVAIAGDRLAVELHREAGREVVRDEDRVRALRHVHRIVVGQAEQQREHADVHVGEVAHALAQHGLGVAAKCLRHSSMTTSNAFSAARFCRMYDSDALDQLDVVEHGELHVEDRRFLGAGPPLGALAHVAQPRAGDLHGVAEARDLALDLLVVDDAMPHLGHLPAQEVHGADDDAGRGGNTAIGAESTQLSPNPSTISSAMASQRGVLVGAARPQRERGAALGGEHHDAHDALAVHLEIVAHNGDVALEPRGGLDDLRGGPRVEAVPVR